MRSNRPKVARGLSPDQIALMERESANLEREFKLAEQSYGTNHLELVLAKGYLTRLLGNGGVLRFLEQHFAHAADDAPADALRARSTSAFRAAAASSACRCISEARMVGSAQVALS